MSWQRIDIMRKEIIQLLRDRRTVATMISLPIIQLVLWYLSNEVLHQPTTCGSVEHDRARTDQAFGNTRYFSIGTPRQT
jgi:hypothetical protein